MKTAIYLFYIVIIVFLALLNYKSYKTNINCVEANKVYEEENSFLLKHVNARNYNWYIDEQSGSFFSTNNTKIELKNIFNGDKLVLRYPEKACDCFDEIINSLVKSDMNLKNNVIIFVPKKKYRYYYAYFLKSELKNFSLIKMDTNVVFTNFDTGIIPYFFLVDSNLQCTNVFLPISNHNELLDNYLNYLSNIYFK